MTLRRFSASRWQGGSRAVRYGSKSSAVNSPGCATCASSARTNVGPSWTIRIPAWRRPYLLELSRADEKPGQEADYQPGHVLPNRIPSLLESIDQLFELLLAIRLILPSGFEGRGYLVDVLDIFSDRLLLGLDMLQSPVDAVGKTAELLFCEPPFFASKFRWIDSRTSCKASAMSRPGGWRGPPWSLLRRLILRFGGLA